MIDFTGTKALTIPEGNVIKVVRKSDNTILWSKSALPSEYQEVEYIYIPTAAYINTEFVPSDGTTFNIKYKNISGNCFGCGSNPRLATTGTSIYNPSNAANGIYRPSELSSGAIVEVETYTSKLGCYVTVNGNKQSQATNSDGSAFNTNFLSTLPMYLGAWSYSATSTRQGELNLYYAKASVNGVPKFEFIPCYRKSDGVAGVYDLVNNRFFTNAGTGEITYA